MAVWQCGGVAVEEGKKSVGELVSSKKVVYLQVENKNADENRNSENS